MPFEAIPIVSEYEDPKNRAKDILQHSADEIQSALARGKYVTHITIHGSEGHRDFPTHVLGFVLVIDTGTPE